METLGEFSLAVDDVVVYASHGVGRVAIRRQESVVVEFATGGLSVTLPIDRAAECIRPVSTEAEIAGIAQTLGGAESPVESNWQRRLIGASRGVDPALADEWIGDQIAVNADQEERLPELRDQTRTAQPFEVMVESSGNRARRRRH